MPKFRQSDYGRFSGASAENDDLSLNRCPDCDVLFSGPCCPICKKECPPHMRAGVRKPIVHVREKAVKGATFTPFYLRWWFIAITFFISRLLAMILLWLSDARKWVKIAITAVVCVILAGEALLYTEWGQSLLVQLRQNAMVNYRISEEEYIRQCREYDYETLFRQGDSKQGDYITGRCRIEDVQYDGFSYNYAARDESGNALVIMDLRKNKEPYLKSGDVVVFYGEYQGINIYIKSDNSNVSLPFVASPYIMLGSDSPEAAETGTESKNLAAPAA